MKERVSKPCTGIDYIILKDSRLPIRFPKITSTPEKWTLPSRKLTARTWKWMVGIRLFPFGAPASFQDLFREGLLKPMKVWEFREVEPVFPTLFRTLCKTNIWNPKMEVTRWIEDDVIPESGREGFFWEKRCHQRLSSKIVTKDCPKFCRIDACPLKIVIKDCPKFRWSDGCP